MGQPRSSTHVLHVQDFAQIGSARVEFGDLTVLVGPQATGKSLLLQWLKLALDAGEVVHALKEAGHDVKSPENLVDLVFGEGMSSAWHEGKTAVSWDNQPIRPASWTRGVRLQREGKAFFIPAHRALLLAEGWPAPFLKLNADTPVVARLFSQNLYQRFSGRQAADLFPVERILKREYREMIDRAIYHGGKVELEKQGLRYRLRLRFEDGVQLPYMAWTAGQREFTPLLLGLYHVLTPRQAAKREDVDWAIIEEPEMGLHPQAIAVVMMLVLDLLWRGYRVVLSTHSPLPLEVVWAIQRLQEHEASGRSLCLGFEVEPTQQVQRVMDSALGRDYKVFFLNLDEQKHRMTARDISRLDPESMVEAEADWGGLTRFSSRFGEVVREAVNEASVRG